VQRAMCVVNKQVVLELLNLNGLNVLSRSCLFAGK